MTTLQIDQIITADNAETLVAEHMIEAGPVKDGWHATLPVKWRNGKTLAVNATARTKAELPASLIFGTTIQMQRANHNRSKQGLAPAYPEIS